MSVKITWDKYKKGQSKTEQNKKKRKIKQTKENEIEIQSKT